MLTYEKALEIAREVKANPITKCIEYTDAYIFSEDIPEGVKYCGGEHSPVVVLKDTGKPVGMSFYAMQCDGLKDENFIREFDI